MEAKAYGILRETRALYRDDAGTKEFLPLRFNSLAEADDWLYRDWEMKSDRDCYEEADINQMKGWSAFRTAYTETKHTIIEIR